MANFCPKCGDPTEPNQKFCEKCGAKINELENTSTPVTTNYENRVGSGGLFDQSRELYVLKEKYWDWGSGDIQDEQGQPIGRMHRKIFSLRRKIELQELDGRVSATIEAKILAIKPTYTLKDENQQNIARLSKTFFSFFRPKMYLQDMMGTKIYIAQGRFMGFDFTITDMSGNLVGEIQKADRWRDIFLGGLFDFKDTYALKILDPSADRRLLVAFVLAIDNILHDAQSSNPRGLRLGT
ncbi:MAG: zinc-ribbon domain-containing protein [archaeon]|nr:zinc-ribbon domain-containing protein [archaeon]